MAVNRLTSGLVALAFPLLERGFTAGGVFFLFTLFSLCTVWFYKVSRVKERRGEERRIDDRMMGGGVVNKRLELQKKELLC